MPQTKGRPPRRIISGAIAERKAERGFNKPYPKAIKVVTNVNVEHRTSGENLGDFAKADRREICCWV
jgi:hypothetical protein